MENEVSTEIKELAAKTSGAKTSLRSALRKVKTCVLGSPRLGEEVPWNFTKNSVGRVRVPAALETVVPQAGVVETGLDAYEERDWRKYFSDKLSGKGLEIGPLHRPMVKHDGMQIDYIDRYTVAELRAHYPELNELPLVESDIIGDAQTLATIKDQKYDFLISAHVVEHMKNPIGALEHWFRVLKPGGLLYLIVPDKRTIFDKKRVRTTLEHLMLDYREPSDERDYEHYLDYAIHVHDKRGVDAIEEADRLVKIDYSIHYHVFVPSDIVNLLNWFSRSVVKIRTLEGPCLAPGSDEFHFLLQKS